MPRFAGFAAYQCFRQIARLTSFQRTGCSGPGRFIAPSLRFQLREGDIREPVTMAAST